MSRRGTRPGRDGEERELAVLQAALVHPRCAEAFHSGRATTIVGSLWRFSTETLARSGTLESLEPLVDASYPVERTHDLLALLDHAMLPAAGLSTDRRERLRTVGVQVLEGAIHRSASGSLDKSYFTHRRDLLTGAAQLGRLIGNRAPAVEVLWTNHPDSPKSLADLRGKVVVLDFFTSWCEPCVAAFPRIRAIVERYRGQPVVVLGITSVQGYHIDPKALAPKPRRTETKGDPEREFALMLEFSTSLQMTWPVLFTAQSAFNPDFGVASIPHLAILDQDGVVRWNGIELERVPALIDELLRSGPAGAASRGSPK